MSKIVLVFGLLFLSGCGPLGPMFSRWAGESDLARAEGSKKVQIEDEELAGFYETATHNP